MHITEDLVTLRVEDVVEGAGVAVVAGKPEGPAKVVGLVELVEDPESARGDAFGPDSLRFLEDGVSSLQRGDPGSESPQRRGFGAARERGVLLEDPFGVRDGEEVEGDGRVGDTEVEGGAGLIEMEICIKHCVRIEAQAGGRVDQWDGNVAPVMARFSGAIGGPDVEVRAREGGLV